MPEVNTTNFSYVQENPAAMSSPSQGSLSDQAKARRRGFAAMSKEQQRIIASKGGKAAHQKGTAHEFSSEEARKAGRKGGQTVSLDRNHMAKIGRKGGERRGGQSRFEGN